MHDYNSKDKTRNILKKLSKRNKSICLNFFDYSISPSHSFLNSINILKNKHRNGDFILFLSDQDDVWEKNKNQVVMNHFDKYNVDVLFHNVLIVNENLKKIKNSYYNKFWNFKRDFKLPNQLLSNCIVSTQWFNSKSIYKFDLEFNEKIPMHDYLTIQILLKNLDMIL